MPKESQAAQNQDTDELVVASRQQVEDAIIELSDNTVAMLKLKYAGRTFTLFALNDLERDLIQEAFARVLAEEESWFYKKQPSFFIFILSTMRSIAWRWKKKSYTKTRQPLDEKALEEQASITASYTYRSPESFSKVNNQFEIKAVWAILLAELIPNPIAHQVLLELIQGKEREEILVILGIDSKTYDSAWRQIKRVARGMLKRDKIWIPIATSIHFPGGC